MNVKLHVYKLSTDNENQWMMSSLLPSIGLGAFHTSLEVNNKKYSFSSTGVLDTLSSNQGVPPGGIFQESIDLGESSMGKRELHRFAQELGKTTFAPNRYHVVHRNCNHFTETLATAMLAGDKLKKKSSTLSTYPAWVNRLAKTSQNIVPHDKHIVPCDPWTEARSLHNITDETVKRDKKLAKKRTEKKQLSEKQKAVLAKIRGGK